MTRDPARQMLILYLGSTGEALVQAAAERSLSVSRLARDLIKQGLGPRFVIRVYTEGQAP